MTLDSRLKDSVLEVIDKLQQGYVDRDIDGVDHFIKEVFTCEPDMTILGTSTDEFCFGVEGIKELLVGDWEGWGDVALDRNSLELINNDEHICFIIQGTVKYTFEHTKERDIRYVNYLKGILEDNNMTNTQRIAFVNWVLSLNFHNREGNPRDYYWPMTLCGVMDGSNDHFSISNLMFSIVPSVYPDERFENNKEYLEEYNEQLNNIQVHSDAPNNKELYSALAQVFADNEGKYDGMFYGPDGRIASIINDLIVEPSSIVSKRFNDLSWLTFFGLQVVNESIEDGEARLLNDMFGIIDSSDEADKKLFQLHRVVSYQLKESAIGETYTNPMRGGALYNHNSGKFDFIHVSHPFYWIMEGKL